MAADLQRSDRLLRNPGGVGLGASVAVNASVAFKGCWVRQTKSFASDEAMRCTFAIAQRWWKADGVALSDAGLIGEQLRAAVRRLGGAQLRGWRAESCRGGYPLEVIASDAADAAAPAGSLVVLSVTLELDGARWLAAAPIIVSASA